jgi:heptosyltransferase III
VTLAVHPGALGDVLLAVPALRALRATSGAPLMLAAQPRIGALLETLAVVDRAVDFDSLGLDALFVDEAASQPRLPDLSRLVCWFGARDAVFARRLKTLVPGAVLASSIGDGTAVWRHLLSTVAAPDGAWCSALEIPEGLRADGVKALAEAGFDGPRPWLIVHPGAGSAAKCWPAEAFARVITILAARRRLNVIVHAGPADEAAAAALRRHLGAGVAWLMNPTLPTLAGVLAQATIYLGNDSGVSHLAAALGVPSLVLFDTRHLAWRSWASGARSRAVTLTDAVPDEIAAVVAQLEAML